VLFTDLPDKNGKHIETVKAAPRLKLDVDAMSKLVKLWNFMITTNQQFGHSMESLPLMVAAPQFRFMIKQKHRRQKAEASQTNRYSCLQSNHSQDHQGFN